MNNRDIITKNYEVMNSVINNLLAECGNQNMYDEFKKVDESRNIIKEVYQKLLMKYEQKQCDKCFKEFVTLQNIIKEKQEEKRNNMIKKYIKRETLNIIGNEVTVQYLVVEADEKVVQVNDINEILLYGRTKCVNFHVHNKTLRDFRLMKNDEILMLILLDNENVDYRDFFKNNFRGITD